VRCNAEPEKKGTLSNLDKMLDIKPAPPAPPRAERKIVTPTEAPPAAPLQKKGPSTKASATFKLEEDMNRVWTNNIPFETYLTMMSFNITKVKEPSFTLATLLLSKSKRAPHEDVLSSDQEPLPYSRTPYQTLILVVAIASAQAQS
jgi:hypothetical protein